MDENSIEFWKAKYEDLNNQYDEFQKHSLELENELELQLKHAEDKIIELQMKNNRLSIENETVKCKLNEINSTTHKQISQLQEELAKFKAVKEEMHKYIRELEQKNDNLEQTNRCAMFSLGEFESKLNEALERNAILQIELDEKDELAEAVQRLRDEARDLKQELAVRQHKAQKDISFMSEEASNTSENQNQSMDTDTNLTIIKSEPASPDKLKKETALNPSPPTNLNELNLQNQQINRKIFKNEISMMKQENGFNLAHFVANQTANSHQQQQQTQQHSVAPTIRIMALNYVGDALRKMTSVESRLVSQRNLMKESNRDRRSATISSVEASRVIEQEDQQLPRYVEPTHSKLKKTSNSVNID